MLEEILCVGTTSVTIANGDGLTVVPTTGPTIPARVRAYVRRDGGCTANGCTSTIDPTSPPGRRRLQPPNK